jgi:hypothetical protein
VAETGRGGLLPHVLGPESLRRDDGLAGGPTPLDEVAHPCGEFLVPPDVDEGGQRPVRAEDAQGPVPGVDQLCRRFHDPPQRHVQVQPGGDAEERTEQPLHPRLGARDRMKAVVLDLGEQIGQAYAFGRRHPIRCRELVVRHVAGHRLTCQLIFHMWDDVHCGGTRTSTGCPRRPLSMQRARSQLPAFQPGSGMAGPSVGATTALTRTSAEDMRRPRTTAIRRAM